MYRIIIWGYGRIYCKHYNQVRYSEKRGDISVVGMTSSDASEEFTLDGYNIYQADVILKMKFDFIIIMNDINQKEIIDGIVARGIDRRKCLSYKIFDIPFFDAGKYFDVIQKPVTIISNNCWGGLVYNALHLECISPFKNLFLEDDDYIRLLERFDYYMECNPRFECYKNDLHSNKRYPVLMLDDIRIHCNHDTNPETAIYNWNRRLKKINRNNLLVEMYTEDENAAKTFFSIEGYDKMYCLSPFEINDERNIQIEVKKDQEFWEAVLATAGSAQPVFYLQDLLLGVAVFRNNIE